MKSALCEFDSYFSSLYKDRWSFLEQALALDNYKEPRKNIFFEKGLLEDYIMDPASHFPPQALNVQKNDKVLDLCAAPGGKSLLLAEALMQTGELVLNEYSAERRSRLIKVIKKYIPIEKRQHIHVTGKDGGLFAKSHPQYFDKILVDAPCSGEKFIIQKNKKREWTLKKSLSLQQRQYALLTAALISLKPGGRMVYSTCSLNPVENDQTIQRLTQKKNGIKICQWTSFNKPFEKTQQGYLFLPDVSHCGPLYLCIIEKK